MKKTPLILAMTLATTFGLQGCSDDSATQTTAASSQQNAMDVKQPEPKAVEFKPLVEPAVKEEVKAEIKAVEEKVVEVQKQAEAKVAEVVKTAEVAKPEAAPAVNGSTVYATCIGCHGAQGEGGMGPKLAGQAVADLVSKINKYKNGEQMGPMTGVMAPMVASLSEADINAVAEHIQSF